MKPVFLLLCLLSLAPCPAKELPSLPLFPENYLQENLDIQETDREHISKVDNKPFISKTNVTQPCVTFYPAPKAAEKTACVLVSPGGAYNSLSYDMEGSEICERLNELGFHAALLKYRVPRRAGKEKHAAPLQDIQRALSLLRAHAKNYGIENCPVGVMGFSAGAHLSAMACSAPRSYSPIDAADTQDYKPDFCALIYPAYLAGKNFSIASEFKITPETPPHFIVQAEDDSSFINSSLFYYFALKNHKIPATMHLFSQGGHGFGLRKNGNAVENWDLLFQDWLKRLLTAK